MKRITLFSLFTLMGTVLSARENVDLCGEWESRPMTINHASYKYSKVNVPSTWNVDYIPGTVQYKREAVVLRRNFNLTDTTGKREFLYFEGVNSYCDVFVNRHLAGSHKGGYTAFCIEVTGLVHDGDNQLELWVSNAFRSDIPPLIGDFNVYGGIHRPCHLIVTGKECIKPDFYASPGVFVKQESISARAAEINVRTLVDAAVHDGLEVRTSIADKSGKVIASAVRPASGTTEIHFSIASPNLWQGRKNPYLYTVKSELLKNGSVVDGKEVKTGFRSLSASRENGILLNGSHYPVHGFAKHESFAGRGSAMLPEDYRTDLNLMLDCGATALRLAHYPHAEIMYELADSSGLLVWTETPMCGPGGGDYAGYIPSEAFKETVRNNLKELVYQKYNHPSICFWGIFNEILYKDGKRFSDYGDPAPFVKELGELFKELDPSRLTTFATCEDEKPYLGSTDLVAWNKYYGWYENIGEAKAFLDSTIRDCGPCPLGLSEYGAGASIRHHAEGITSASRIKAKFHPEEKQSAVHEDNWALFSKYPSIWGTFIWNLADFQSANRNEGDTPGINDKGLVTYDRKVKKDAWWFYKAQWNPEPMIYITSRRFTPRTQAETDIKVYTTCRKATLFLNGRKISDGTPDELGRIIWKGVWLEKGDNEILVTSGKGKTMISDKCNWRLE